MKTINLSIFILSDPMQYRVIDANIHKPLRIKRSNVKSLLTTEKALPLENMITR